MLYNRFIQVLRKQSFQPNLLSIFINPYFLIRKELKKNIVYFIPQLKGRLMDFGCGRKPYENLFSVDEYIGVDIQTTGHDHTLSRIDVFYDGQHIPLPDGSFDAIFSSEVLEHIFNPDQILPELNRVLRNGGKILLTVPFCWNEHEIPYDYGRYSSYGIKHLLTSHGFKVIELRKSGNFITVLFQLWILYISELFKSCGRLGLIISLVFIAPFNLISLIISPLMPRNKSLYFNNVVLAEKISPAW
jgi:SAM-dependent methyltransferase